MPAITEFFGNDFVTTEPCPITQPSSITTPFKMETFEPMKTLLPIITSFEIILSGLFLSFVFRPWKSELVQEKSLPIKQSVPIVIFALSAAITELLLIIVFLPTWIFEFLDLASM